MQFFRKHQLSRIKKRMKSPRSHITFIASWIFFLSQNIHTSWQYYQLAWSYFSHLLINRHSECAYHVKVHLKSQHNLCTELIIVSFQDLSHLLEVPDMLGVKKNPRVALTRLYPILHCYRRKFFYKPCNSYVHLVMYALKFNELSAFVFILCNFPP